MRFASKGKTRCSFHLLRGILLGSMLAGASSLVAAAQAKPDPCAGVKPADAASILKVPVSDIDGPKSFKSFTCYYRSKRHPYTTLSFNLYVESTPEQAAQKLASLKEGFTFLSPIRSLKHLGDEAYLAPDSRVRRLLIRKGRFFLDVTTPGDRAAQIRIAKIVLKYLH